MAFLPEPITRHSESSALLNVSADSALSVDITIPSFRASGAYASIPVDAGFQQRQECGAAAAENLHRHCRPDGRVLDSADPVAQEFELLVGRQAGKLGLIDTPSSTEHRCDWMSPGPRRRWSSASS